ncbi:hypothetical protein TCAL_04107 [Tigriopus californicus]|uniref:CREG-like beta-barrel domain-containing protein n=1 Tax=Tigriopus californicus TaxID=6832 RepID=A0A553NS02_TIGCA|nr:protein CREG1-like [Tigriopus californicus]TRY68218.1 hypothetical protein TCAL_04107 [Tigriopus californicus]|eukprot:TCALIF_04107-PA protein Name:"Similar to CREG1 Protein CREG1 (Gallus gallus)" AED:0.08 eAED:0.08 QI:193/1/1/1/1/1/4/36/230
MKTLPLLLIIFAFGVTVSQSLVRNPSLFDSIFSIFVSDNEIHSETPALPKSLDPGPPPHEEAARMARYVTHHSDWAAMATISARNPIKGYPFANVFSVSDGPSMALSTGIPYMYLTPLEMSVHDIKENNQASLTMSLAQGKYCDQKQYDPEDPRCAHIILTGTIQTVAHGTKEEAFAKDALFSRHPEMTDWPKDHGWFFGKMDIENVLVLDFFGGAKTVPVEEYFKAKPF